MEDNNLVAPPHEIKSIIDKTAEWVSKNGDDFEKKLMVKQEGDPRFNFLRQENIHYAYYQQIVRMKKNEQLNDDRTSIEKAAEEKIKLKKVLLGELPEDQMPKSHIKKKDKQPPSGTPEVPLEKPLPDVWIIERPQPMSGLQDDVIKLSAQFVARNGRLFQQGLLYRENKNSLFGFLQPYHPHHQYFKKLVNAYTKCLLPEKETLSKLEEQEKDKQGIINKMLKRVYYERAQKKTEKQKKER